MPKRTLVDMVQNIMSSMDSDAVNSISDTGESDQIADIIETTYYDLITNQTIPEHKEIFELDALTDATRPAMMEVPSTVDIIEWIKYDRRQSSTDTRLRFEDIKYKSPEVMLDLLNSRDSTDTTTVVNMPSKNTISVDLLVKNNANPSWWTMFDDRYIVFDAYDSSIDSTLQKSKTQCYGIKEPTWTKSDSFTPDLDIDLFPLLLSVSKAVSFATLKSANNPAVSGAARSHIIRTQAKKHKAAIVDSSNVGFQPSFGRAGTLGTRRSDRSRRSQ
jgi:hypothetical protein